MQKISSSLEIRTHHFLCDITNIYSKQSHVKQKVLWPVGVYKPVKIKILYSGKVISWSFKFALILNVYTQSCVAQYLWTHKQIWNNWQQRQLCAPPALILHPLSNPRCVFSLLTSSPSHHLSPPSPRLQLTMWRSTCRSPWSSSCRPLRERRERALSLMPASSSSAS